MRLLMMALLALGVTAPTASPAKNKGVHCHLFRSEVRLTQQVSCDTLAKIGRECGGKKIQPCTQDEKTAGHRLYKDEALLKITFQTSGPKELKDEHGKGIHDEFTKQLKDDEKYKQAKEGGELKTASENATGEPKTFVEEDDEEGVESDDFFGYFAVSFLGVVLVGGVATISITCIIRRPTQSTSTPHPHGSPGYNAYGCSSSQTGSGSDGSYILDANNNVLSGEEVIPDTAFNGRLGESFLEVINEVDESSPKMSPAPAESVEKAVEPEQEAQKPEQEAEEPEQEFQTQPETPAEVLAKMLKKREEAIKARAAEEKAQEEEAEVVEMVRNAQIRENKKKVLESVAVKPPDKAKQQQLLARRKQAQIQKEQELKKISDQEKKLLEDAAAKKKRADEAAKEKEEAAKKQEEEKIAKEAAAKKKLDEEVAKKKVDGETAARKKLNDEIAKKKFDEEVAEKKLDGETAAKKKSDDEIAKKKFDEEVVTNKEEAAKKLEEERVAKEILEEEEMAGENPMDRTGEAFQTAANTMIENYQSFGEPAEELETRAIAAQSPAQKTAPSPQMPAGTTPVQEIVVWKVVSPVKAVDQPRRHINSSDEDEPDPLLREATLPTSAGKQAAVKKTPNASPTEGAEDEWTPGGSVKRLIRVAEGRTTPTGHVDSMVRSAERQRGSSRRAAANEGRSAISQAIPATPKLDENADPDGEGRSRPRTRGQDSHTRPGVSKPRGKGSKK